MARNSPASFAAPSIPPCPTDRPADYPTILYFYGNGQVAAWALYEVDIFRRCGANVLLADYPGYGLSTGTVTEQGCYQTGEALWTYATNSPEIDPHRLIAVGWSLGGAMAIDLAQRHPVQGLVTVSAFTRIKTVAQRQFWFVPAALMLKYDFPNDTKLPAITCPTLIIHGTSDELVPYSMSNDLLALSPAPSNATSPSPTPAITTSSPSATTLSPKPSRNFFNRSTPLPLPPPAHSRRIRPNGDGQTTHANKEAGPPWIGGPAIRIHTHLIASGSLTSPWSSR